jgi:hypothetical protein
MYSPQECVLLVRPGLDMLACTTGLIMWHQKESKKRRGLMPGGAIATYGAKICSTQRSIISLSIHAFSWQAYMQSFGKVGNSLLTILPLEDPLKIRKGVSERPLAVTVNAQVTLFVSFVDFLMWIVGFPINSSVFFSLKVKGMGV